MWCTNHITWWNSINQQFNHGGTGLWVVYDLEQSCAVNFYYYVCEQPQGWSSTGSDGLLYICSCKNYSAYVS